MVKCRGNERTPSKYRIQGKRPLPFVLHDFQIRQERPLHANKLFSVVKFILVYLTTFIKTPITQLRMIRLLTINNLERKLKWSQALSRYPSIFMERLKKPKKTTAQPVFGAVFESGTSRIRNKSGNHSTATVGTSLNNLRRNVLPPEFASPHLCLQKLPTDSAVSNGR